MSKNKIILESALDECARHYKRLNGAHRNMKVFMPLNTEKYKNLKDDEIVHIDQYIYRFSKLQDTISQKLFRSLINYLGEESEGKSFIDIFNKLEQLRIINDFNSWSELREIRNELSNEYSEDTEENVLKMNKIYELKDTLINYYINIQDYLKRQDEV